MRQKYEYFPPENGYPEWNNNPEIFELNRMRAHATLMPFDTVTEALTGNKSTSKYYRTLNGIWKFSFSKTPEERNKNFYKQDFDYSSWEEIKVPGHWQLQGFDYPQYTNIRYPWENTEPLVPPFAPIVYNPVGSYVRTFEIPEDWKGSPVFISFQGVESAFYVWINGDLVGYSEDSFTPSEFDITPYLKEGTNKLAVEVYRWSDASWLEDQDFWRLSGIFREVYLYSIPEVHIYDFSVVTDLDDQFKNATIKVKATLINYYERVLGNLTLEAQLYNQEGQPILAQPIPMTGLMNKVAELELQGEAIVDEPLQWSAEQPNLYTLVLSLRDSSGKLIEVECSKVGFRRFEIKDNLMLINGKRILFKGVDRHEFSADTGRTLGHEEMLTDIKLMKAFNINAVRTSHYPNDVYWYELCDEYGIYIIDENNLETHGSWDYGSDVELPGILPGSKPEWTAAVLDRCNSMLQRDKNHPCVLIWSLGNESWGGDNFIKMHDFLKKNDPSRIVHYEGVTQARTWDDASDIESQMYTKVEAVEAYALNKPKKPFILCEYSHAMGNSCGDLFKYCELFDIYSVLQGGFIWDWIDQAILTKTSEGIDYLAYGGDFNEPRHDGNFCGNGIIFADRTVTPKLYEVKRCYQSIGFEAIDLSLGKIKLHNKFLFTDLKEYELIWDIKRNGFCIMSGTGTVSVEPLCNVLINLGYELPERLSPEDEYILTLSMITTKDYPWAEKGHEIAFEQFILPIKTMREKVQPIIDSPLLLQENTSEYIISSEDFAVTFCKVTGTMTSYYYKGEELIKEAPIPNFWRAYTDNDKGNKLQERCELWRDASQVRELVKIQKSSSDHRVIIEVKYTLPAASSSSCFISYTITGDGEVKIHEVLAPGLNLPEIPEIGMMLSMDKAYDHMEWYGRGPHENYWDRANGARVGIYHGKVSEQMVPYLRPQECGNRTEVRWARITNQNGKGFIIEGFPYIELNALPYTPFEIEEKDHHYKLPASEKTVVRINYRQMGVGGDDSWGAKTHPEFTLFANSQYEYTYSIKGWDESNC